MAGDKDLVVTFSCGMVLLVVLNVWFWSSFASDISFYSGQRAAMCVDGRLLEEELLQSRLGVDDSKRKKGVIKMQCSFPVAVYPCLDADVELGDWSGHCRTLATAPMYPESEWPRRMEDPDLRCCERSCIGRSKCSDLEWSCSTGPCDAYEKSLRMCSGRMRKEPYKCFTSEGDSSAGIREDAPGFPAGWLALGVLTACCGLVICVVSIIAIHNEPHWLFLALSFLCAQAIFAGCAWVVVLIVRAFQGENDNKGLVEKEYQDLAVTTGDNQTVILAEALPPEGMHWALVLLIVFGSIIGTAVLCFGVLVCFAMCKEYGWSARAKAVEYDTSRKDRAARVSEVAMGKMRNIPVFGVGDEVTLNPTFEFFDPEALKGVLAPGDIGKVVDFKEGERGVVVQCPEKGDATWCYKDESLSIYCDDLQKGASLSSRSVFSGKSNRDLARGASRDELNTLVKSVSGLSRAEKIGHVILNHAEDVRTVVQKIVPQKIVQQKASEENLALKGQPPMPQHRVIGQAASSYAHIPQTSPSRQTSPSSLVSSKASQYLARASSSPATEFALTSQAIDSTVEGDTRSICRSCGGTGRQGLLGPVGLGVASFACKQCNGSGFAAEGAFTAASSHF